MADLIQTRRDTYDNWWSVNPILANGEVGIITHASGSGNATSLNPLQCIVGDGSTTWRNHVNANPTHIQAWAEPGLSGSINQRIDEVSGSLHTEVNALSGSLESLEDNIGHYTCNDQGTVLTKTVSAPNYTRITGGAFKVKFNYKHTATSGTVTLKVGNAAAANLYYDGAPVTNNNTWEAGETVDVYFDGTNYQANNVSGGGTFATGEKVKNVGIDDEPTANSNNLVKSGGVATIANFLKRRLIKLVGAGVSHTDAGVTSVGEYYYNTSTKTIRQLVTLNPNNEIVIPYEDGAIYTLNNTLYLYYEGGLKSIADEFYYNYISSLRNDVFCNENTALLKNGTTSNISGFYTTPLIPVSEGETIKVGGYSGGNDLNYSLLCAYGEDKTTLIGAYGNDSVGYEEIELTIPANAYYIRVGSREDNINYNYLSNSYVDAKITGKILAQLNGISTKFATGEELNNVNIADNLSNTNDLVKGSGILSTINAVDAKIDDLDEQLYGIARIASLTLSTEGCITFDPITLHENGDELEFTVLPADGVNDTTSGQYAFTFGSSNGTLLAVGISRNYANIRSTADRTWIFGPAYGVGYINVATNFRIKYTSGNIEFWKNDALLGTYTGQKDVAIYGIGSQGMSTKWAGTIYKFAYTHNNVTTQLEDLTGFSANSGVTIVYNRQGGDITNLQNQIQKYPKFKVFPTSNSINVYFNIHDNVYGVLPINHIVNHDSDTQYCDFWGISNQGANIGYFATYSNEEFTNKSERLLVGAENEFAIQFYADDFTGGVHGDERIDLDENCYVVFIVDGKEYTISELVSLGNIECNSFAYRQKSVLYTRWEDTNTHDPIAYHVKYTEFVEGGYLTRNYIEMLATMTIKNAYCGLVCVHKDIADYVVNNYGTIYTATHPSTSYQISGLNNKIDNRIKMFKGNGSCKLDAKVIGGNVTSYNEAGAGVMVWDRSNDTKYYATLPQNIQVTNTNVFGFECSVKWDYKID